MILMTILMRILMNIFVYIPALLFWIVVAACVWANADEKKHKERHDDDGK